MTKENSLVENSLIKKYKNDNNQTLSKEQRVKLNDILTNAYAIKDTEEFNSIRSEAEKMNILNTDIDDILERDPQQ